MMTEFQQEEWKGSADLQHILDHMTFIARDFMQIQCLDSLCLVDRRGTVLFCAGKNGLQNDKAGRGEMTKCLETHPEILQEIKESIRQGEKRKRVLESPLTVLAIPLEGPRKAMGAMVLTYRAEGHSESVCAVDSLFQDLVGIHILRYQGEDQKENLAKCNARLKSLEDYEKFAILAAGEKFHWNITSMAKELEIGRNTLYNKMKRLGIS
ncbi:hypothetical protein KCG48_07690 [Proteiniclasticum sp. BAD-10]|uniref:DNA binding HTH domain-containing protein n=1 Tax=Proteiniclasticum sediminis TaxID=2804028 RepID=A0A941HQ90_9CLOT|nr:helix-turn-helix domain-containing protein [Proteiniclasticum sediminis]MBR0576224.1 hypothetical protein [Proteiniclasticum sediminis]